jgi:NADH:ubiquinone oxidoreductase subunit
MKTFLLQFFTWWSGQTIGTRFHTWRHGQFVGEDEFGNRYYQTKDGKLDPAIGIVRRWVVYPAQTEATLVPPGWVGWLRGTTEVPPSQEDYTPREWEKPHRPNMTGTSQASRPAATGDYEAWTPGQ